MFPGPSAKCARLGHFLFLRSLTTEATCAVTRTPTLPVKQATRPQKSDKTSISTAIVLNRAPILTRSSTPFETAYYSYQARIRRALHNPFPYDFYFKQGTLIETRFNLEERKRERLAFGPAFLSKEDVSEEKRAADIAAVEQLAQQEGEGEVLMPRTHPSDTSGDVRSLDRKGQRNLYLLLHVLENGKETWRFPLGKVEKGQFLHQAAQKDLYAECGDEMDTWVVGKAPIGVYKPRQTSAEAQQASEIVFLFKAHIMAGQVKPQGDHIEDFAWLTKEEIKMRVHSHYWDGIKDILSDH
ncbi:50S ribosomal subunit L30 [Pholiota conissans]|uniref:Large ribosomal subunit protein mL46 n=1 Tax=Pholiota conissans TaxID=109636 RepID=A0A9P5YU76_9AGAR|nr:50S ribosomal subunit L30 [Pholiota conissans]